MHFSASCLSELEQLLTIIVLYSQRRACLLIRYYRW
jgi:hypothetical protein